MSQQLTLTHQQKTEVVDLMGKKPETTQQMAAFKDGVRGESRDQAVEVCQALFDGNTLADYLTDLCDGGLSALCKAAWYVMTGHPEKAMKELGAAFTIATAAAIAITVGCTIM